MKRHPGCHGATAATRVPAAVGMVAFLLLALLPGTSGAYLTLAQEAAVMIKLRHDLHSAQPALAQKLVDWRPNSTAVPCGWEMVVCDTQLRITNLDLRWFSPEDKAARRFSPTGMRPVVADSGNASAAGSAPALRLPPELARMRHLEKFSFGMTVRLALPSEWGQPGSFPSLLWLSVHGGSLEGALPDIRPGAMLLLRTIRLQFTSTTVMLPPSWGSRVDVLPALNELEVLGGVTGVLPPEWARGLQSLQRLHLGPLPGFQRMPAERPAVPPGTDPAQRFTLPPEWGAGFPKLELLLLDELGLTGRFPGTWQHGFPALQSIVLSRNSLTGPLPPQLPKGLFKLGVSHNLLTGTLPPEWNTSIVEVLDLGDNFLSGPAFPPAWLHAGAVPMLTFFDLSGNTKIGGTLPASLPWPIIRSMFLAKTNVHGRVPQGWCQAVAAADRLLSLNIDSTSVDAQMPRCAAGRIEVMGSEFMPGSNSGPAGAATARQPALLGPAAVASLATLLPMLILVAVGVGGRALFRHRQGRFRWQRLEQGNAEDPLPPTFQRSSTRGGGEGAAGDALPPGVSFVGLNRRARRDALRRCGLARSNSDQQVAGRGLGGIELLPLEALPEALAHRLGSLRARAAPGSTLSGSPGTGASPQPGSGAADAAARSRQWGLPTDSMRISPGELQLCEGEDGQLVELGEGAHAVVYLGELNGDPVAVKVLELPAGADSAVMWHEVLLARLCTHPRIVPVYGVSLQVQLFLMAMQLMRGGSLRSALLEPEKQQQLRWSASGRQVALDIAEALHFMHTRMQIVHSDLKAANVLLSGELRAYVADLGLAQLLEGRAHTLRGGSLVYAAPEQLMYERCTVAVDMYSFAVLLSELTTRQLATKRGEWRLPRVPDECPQAVVQLIQDCMAFDPVLRPTAAEALQRLQAAG